LVGWSLTSFFSTNTAISETRADCGIWWLSPKQDPGAERQEGVRSEDPSRQDLKRGGAAKMFAYLIASNCAQVLLHFHAIWLPMTPDEGCGRLNPPEISVCPWISAIPPPEKIGKIASPFIFPRTNTPIFHMRSVCSKSFQYDFKSFVGLGGKPPGAFFRTDVLHRIFRDRCPGGGKCPIDLPKSYLANCYTAFYKTHCTRYYGIFQNF